MKHTIECQENLDVLQCEVAEILVENNKVVGIKTSMGEIFSKNRNRTFNKYA